MSDSHNNVHRTVHGNVQNTYSAGHSSNVSSAFLPAGSMAWQGAVDAENQAKRAEATTVTGRSRYADTTPTTATAGESLGGAALVALVLLVILASIVIDEIVAFALGAAAIALLYKAITDFIMGPGFKLRLWDKVFIGILSALSGGAGAYLAGSNSLFYWYDCFFNPMQAIVDVYPKDLPGPQHIQPVSGWWSLLMLSSGIFTLYILARDSAWKILGRKTAIKCSVGVALFFGAAYFNGFLASPIEYLEQKNFSDWNWPLLFMFILGVFTLCRIFRYLVWRKLSFDTGLNIALASWAGVGGICLLSFGTGWMEQSPFYPIVLWLFAFPSMAILAFLGFESRTETPSHWTGLTSLQRFYLLALVGSFMLGATFLCASTFGANRTANTVGIPREILQMGAVIIYPIQILVALLLSDYLMMKAPPPPRRDLTFFKNFIYHRLMVRTGYLFKELDRKHPVLFIGSAKNTRTPGSSLQRKLLTITKVALAVLGLSSGFHYLDIAGVLPPGSFVQAGAGMANYMAPFGKSDALLTPETITDIKENSNLAAGRDAYIYDTYSKIITQINRGQKVHIIYLYEIQGAQIARVALPYGLVGFMRQENLTPESISH